MGVIVDDAPRAVPGERASFVERESCPSCRDPRSTTIWSGRFADEPVRDFITRHHYAGSPMAALGAERFRLVRCAGCTLVYHARVLDPSGLARLYGEWIDAHQIERFEAEHAAGASPALRFEDARQIFKHLLRMHDLAGGSWPFRLLDFGCGDGRALRIAASLGLEAHGVDPSTTRSERAQGVGLCVHPTIEAALGACEGPFDAALLMEVLEHVVEPRATLEAIAQALRPGGVVLIEVPDGRGIDGPPTSFEQMRLVHPLEHVNAFTPDTLEAIAREVGLVPAPKRAAHATTRLTSVLRTELSRFVRRPSTSRYFVRS